MAFIRALTWTLGGQEQLKDGGGPWQFIRVKDPGHTCWMDTLPSRPRLGPRLGHDRHTHSEALLTHCLALTQYADMYFKP